VIKAYWYYISRMTVSCYNYYILREKRERFEFRNALIHLNFLHYKMEHEGWFDEPVQQ